MLDEPMDKMEDSMRKVKIILEGILVKRYKDFSCKEKALVTDMAFDNQRGRKSPILSSNKNELVDFFKLVEHIHGESYSNLPDKVRWEIEDLYLSKE